MKIFGFSFLRVKRICDVDGSIYLWRLNLIQFPSGRSVKLHVFLRSDVDRHLHDHPWNFATFVLWRGYFEETDSGRTWYGPGSFLYRRAGHRHRVILADGRPSWTLFFSGPYRREWGFWTECGWQQWATYWDKKVRGDPICD